MAKDQKLIVNNAKNHEGQRGATRMGRSVRKPTDQMDTRALYHHVERAWNSAAMEKASPTRDHKIHSIRLPSGVVANLQFRRDGSGHFPIVQPGQAKYGSSNDDGVKVEGRRAVNRSGAFGPRETRPPAKLLKLTSDKQCLDKRAKQRRYEEFFPHLKSEESLRSPRKDPSQQDVDDEQEMVELQLREEEDEDQRKVRFELRPVAVDQVLDSLYFMVEALSQKGLKRILQCWIRECHPGKQGTHPYNGGNTAQNYTDYDRMNPGQHTAPPYWPNQRGWREKVPTACRHREPHHTRKWERQCLAAHLLRIGPYYAEDGFDFSLDKLEKATEGICQKNKNDFPVKAEAVLASIYRAMKAFQSYEKGERDGDSVIQVFMTDPNKTKRLNDDSSDDESEKRQKNNASADQSSNASQFGQPSSASSSFSSFDSDAAADSNTFNLRSLREGVETTGFHGNDPMVSSSSVISDCSHASHGLPDSYYAFAGHGEDVKPTSQELSVGTAPAGTKSGKANSFRLLPDPPYNKKQAAVQTGFVENGLEDAFSRPAKHIKLDPSARPSVSSSMEDSRNNVTDWGSASRSMMQHYANRKGFVSAADSANCFQSFNEFAGNQYLLDDPSWYPTQWDLTDNNRAINWGTSASGTNSPTAPDYLSPYNPGGWHSSLSASPDTRAFAWPQACEY